MITLDKLLLKKEQNQPINNKKINVLWSGGMDSTFLVYGLLKSGYKVDVYSVDFTNYTNGFEKDARKALIKLFKRDFSKQFSYNKNLMKITYFGLPNTNNPQLISWLFATTSYVKKGFNDFALGYVKGDHDVENNMNISQKIIEALNFLNETKVFLHFPLSDFNKWEIYSLLPKEYLDKVVWCYRLSKSLYGDCDCAACKRMGGHNEYYFLRLCNKLKINTIGIN